MSRVQLALNVSDIDAAVEFYSKLFGAEPAKRPPWLRQLRHRRARPSSWCSSRTPEARGTGVAGALNHLGVEVETPEEVQAATRRLAAEGLAPDVQESTTCCYAVQDKAWVNDPDGAPWEVYTVLADAPDETGLAGDGSCCAGAEAGELVTVGADGLCGLLLSDGTSPEPTEAVMDEAALWRRLLAELLGSAFLAAVVIGSGIAAQQLSPGDVGLELFENAAATAAGLSPSS